MNDQTSSQTTNAKRQAKLPNKEDWSVQRSSNPGTPLVTGFLQLCADRRFHRAIRDRFQQDAGLSSPEDYWIHSDAGGTPKMECLRTAPDYCYYDKRVRLMGWSAHGDICGGFGPNVPDEAIQDALIVVSGRKVEEYPEATHFVYFATIIKGGDGDEAVVHCTKIEKAAD